MVNPRKYGESPYRVAVIHGGPGAPGSIAPVARELSGICGVLEPLQTKHTLDEQVEELKETLEEHGNLPIILVGWSHGSGLSTLLTVRYPDIVRKLIVIGMTPFDAKYQDEISRRGLSRLSEEERVEYLSLLGSIQDSANEDRVTSLTRLAPLISKMASYELLPSEDEVIEHQLDILLSIGQEWRQLLDKSELLKIIPDIKCPVVAIQGDYDANPAEAINEQFSNVIKNFKFYVLGRCGHTPWYEKYARDTFYAILKNEITETEGVSF